MLHVWSKYHNVIIWYHNNILISLTKNQTCCILRTPFDIVVNALFNHGFTTEFNLSKIISFYKYAHNSGPRGGPDMLLSAFDVKFHETKNELPPDAWNRQTKFLKTQKTQRRKNVKKMQHKMGPPEPPPARPCGGSGGRQPPGIYLCVA